MKFESLRIRSFRNLEHVDLEPSSGFNVVVGPNGHGKSNLLEAIYYLAALKSFRGARNADLVRHGDEAAFIEGSFDRGGVRRDVTVRLKGRGRSVRLNDKAVRSLRDFFGTVNTVVFTPDDVGLVRGSPSDRRLFFDRMIFNLRPSFASDMSDYEDALKARNRLLKADYPDRALLEAFEGPWLEKATRIIMLRAAFVRELRGPLQEAFAEIFGDLIDLRLRYVAKTFETSPPEDADAIRDHLTKALRDAYRADAALGYTTVGPHRDDVELSFGDHLAKVVASQGQQRALVLALKITEIRRIEQEYGHSPILLLDDVSSELDPERNRKLFTFLSGFSGQVFISSTDRKFIDLPVSSTTLEVSNGQISVTDDIS